MQRDFVGYGGNSPIVVWPERARLAINFVLNYEEGAESNILNGDEESESYLTDLPFVTPLKNDRHLSVESMFEYGSRAGVWRLLNLFEEHQIPLTLFATGLALERNPPLIQHLKQSTHEIAGHGYRWINYRYISEETEKLHIKKTIEGIEMLTQKKVKGWYTGRRSPNTRKLIVEAGLYYDSESYADDLPYWIHIQESLSPHLVIPYSLDCNDLHYATSPGWNTGTDFFEYLKATFDCLYREGEKYPKMMTISIHSRFSGRPGRAEALSRFINYLKEFDHLWICRREDIADHWYRHHPFKD